MSSEQSGSTWPEQEVVAAWLMRHGISVPFIVQCELQDQLTALRPREVEPGRVFYAWLFEDGSFDWELHAVERYAREAANAEEHGDPLGGKIQVIPVRVVHAEVERYNHDDFRVADRSGRILTDDELQFIAAAEEVVTRTLSSTAPDRFNKLDYRRAALLLKLAAAFHKGEPR